MNPLNALNGLNSVNNINEITFQSNPLTKTNRTDTASKSAFEEFFSAALKLLNETNDLQIADERLQVDYAAGKTDDILAVIMAQQKAYTSLSFTVQVTNKVIEAYREIMRISV